MDVIATIYWSGDKYKLVSAWNETLVEGTINDICRGLKEEDSKAREKDKKKKLENKK